MSRVVMSGRLTSQVALSSELLRCFRAVAATVLVAACSSSRPPPSAQPAAPAAAAAAVPAEAPTCVDAKDQRVQCLTDADCCARFVCGKDPELSQSVNYCIFGG
jgi:uncharacterized lipoprotein YajG